MLANFAHITDLAHRALELGVVLGAIEGTFLVRVAAVNGSETAGANVELCKLVELDLHRVVGVALTLSLDLLGLDE